LYVPAVAGTHVGQERITYVKATHAVLEPVDPSLVDVDGERYPCVSTFVSVQPSAARLLC
jgi:hypothetical protein